jgi:hypothetical protein
MNITIYRITIKRAKTFILGLSLVVECAFATGCSGLGKAYAVNDAVSRGMISGLAASNACNLKALVWGFPALPSGPFSKIGSLPVMVWNGPANKDWYVFFCGKSEDPKAWQVFSCMKWQNDHWEPRQVPQ